MAAAYLGLTTHCRLSVFVVSLPNIISSGERTKTSTVPPESNRPSGNLTTDTAVSGTDVAAATKRTPIQWTSALDESLVLIDESCGPARRKGRRQRLLEEWNRVHPNLQSTEGALF